MQKKLLIAAIVVVLLFIVIIVLVGVSQKGPQTQQQEKQQPSELTNIRESILATDPSDPAHVNNLKYLQEALERYYKEKHRYPTKLSELAPNYVPVVYKYSSNQDYFYAYYPATNPNKYHLGSLLGGRNEASPAAFASDSDFNSENAGYVNGFHGADPVYDLIGGEK